MDAFDQIVNQFNNAVAAWQVPSLLLASRLFVILAGIQIIWAGIIWMLNRDDPTNLMINFVKKLMGIFFFWAILINYDAWFPTIINSFRSVGQQLSGTLVITPTTIAKRGVELSTLVLSSARNDGWFTNIGSSLLSSFVAAILFYIFIRIAIEMVLILIGGRIILMGGIIMLGFAGSKWTMQFAEKYFTTAINLGIKLLFIMLVIAVGETLSPGWASIIKTAPKADLMSAYMAVVGAAFVYYFLALKIPDMASNLLTGSFTMGFSQSVSGALSAGATTALYAGTVGATGVSNFGKSTVGTLAGGISAIREAASVGFAQEDHKGTTGNKRTILGAGNAIKTLAVASIDLKASQVKESIGKTSGGQLARHINVLKARGTEADAKNT